jgi:2-phospho-L-lactate guanylyltransferase
MAMLQDVIVSLSRGRRLAGIAVVSGDPVAERIARAHGATFIGDPAENCDINSAVTFGTGVLRRIGAGLVAIIPADVPLVDANEVEEGLDLAHRTFTTVVIPDRRRSGTNGLMFAAGAPPEFSYGSDSFTKYLQQGVAMTPLKLGSLELDIDDPPDLQLLAQCKHRAADLMTMNVLEKLSNVSLRDAAMVGRP